MNVLTINKRIESDVTVIEPIGRIDLTTLPEFTGTLNNAVDEGSKKILINFSKTEYMTSAGVRAILEILRKLEAQKGQLVFCSPSEMLMELFAVIQLNKLLKIYNTEFEALDVLIQK